MGMHVNKVPAISNGFVLVDCSLWYAPLSAPFYLGLNTNGYSNIYSFNSIGVGNYYSKVLRRDLLS